MTSRNQVMAIAAILLVVGAVDFVQRIHVPRSPETREPNLEAPALPKPPISLADARQRLQSWFPAEAPPQDDVQAAANNAPVDATASMPDRGDIAGWRFILRGVFDAGPSFAVLDVMSSSGGEIEQHRLATGEVIKGVTVERISGHSIDLSDGETKLKLALFVEPENNVAPVNEQN